MVLRGLRSLLSSHLVVVCTVIAYSGCERIARHVGITGDFIRPDINIGTASMVGYRALLCSNFI